MAPPSLVDLCAKKLNDMEGFTKGRQVTDEYWEKFYEKKFRGGKMAPPSLVDLCAKNLKDMEWSTKEREVTDKYWETLYEQRFGNTRGNNVPCKWKPAYGYKEEEINLRRLILEEDVYPYCGFMGAGNNGSNSATRKVRLPKQ